MDKMDSSLTSSPLPSASPLTGTIRPNTAAAAVGVAYDTLYRKPKRTWTTSSDLGAGPRPEQQVSELSKAASRHLGVMTAARPAPYSRSITPSERQAAEAKLRSQLSRLAIALQDAQAGGGLGHHHSAEHADSFATGQPYGVQGEGTTHDHHPMKPLTPAALIKSLKEGFLSRPSSSLSVQDFSLPRPFSKADRSYSPVSASWSGPLPRLGTAGTQGGDFSAPATPPRTPKRLGSRGGLLRASAPVPLAMLAAAVGARPPPGSMQPTDVWVNPTALPSATKASDAAAAAATSLPHALQPAANTEAQRERALMRASMGNKVVADATGSQAAAAAAAAATAKLLASRTSGTLPTNAEADAAVSAVTARLRATLEAPPLGAPGNPRWGPGQPLERFVPTRGMVYSVFNELDTTATGKVTYSMFEEAAVRVGLREDQVRRLYGMLDSGGRGYVTVRDWGRADTISSVTDFTRLYVQVTRGAGGRPAGVRELMSASLAMQLALERLQVRNHGHSVSRSQLLEAFRFLDTDGSGALTPAEMADAFNGMGIYVGDVVIDELVSRFDHNQNGTIEYDEFVKTLFPVLSKSLALD